MWLKSNAITNLAYDLQSSDPEIARAAPRRFALARTPSPTRSTIPRLVGLGGKTCKSKSVVNLRSAWGRAAKPVKEGGLPQLLRAVQKPPSRTARHGSRSGITSQQDVVPSPKATMQEGFESTLLLANDFSLTSGLETVVKDAQGSSRGVWLASRLTRSRPTLPRIQSGSITRRATPRRRKGNALSDLELKLNAAVLLRRVGGLCAR